MSESKEKINECSKLAIAWVDLECHVPSLFTRQTKLILNGISGSIDFGTLNALMGPSGAGKSTLLKCINGHQKTSRDTNIYLSAERKIKSCFIVQDISTHLLNGLTVIQTLIYASKLKNIGIECDHKMNAKKLLAELMIAEIEKTSVDDCSGGERKRLVIAMELMAVNKPNVMCVDEPTSGLDSNAAEVVIQCLQEVSRVHNIAVVTSIHQPNSDVLMLFDSVYVIGKGGQCVYCGPPMQLAFHLSEAEIECKEFQVPIEVLLKIASKNSNKLEALVNQTKRLRKGLLKKCTTEGKLSSNGVLINSATFHVKHFWYLMRRMITYSLRSQWKAMSIQFLFILFICYIMTKLFNPYAGEPDGCFTIASALNTSEESLRIESLLAQNLKLQFFLEIVIQFLLIVSNTLLFASEISIFFNEHKNGWYSSGAYYSAKSVVELPLTLLIAVCYVAIAYNGNHQIADQNRFLGYMAITVTSVVCTQGLAFTIGIVSNANDRLAIVLIIGIAMFNAMLSGFFAPLQELPKAAQWLPHLSFFKHGFENHMILLYGFDRCPKGQIQGLLYQLSLSEDTTKKFWINVIEMCSLVVVYRITAFIAMVLKANTFNLRLYDKFIANTAKSATKHETNSVSIL